jgi:hypothetical protein
MRDLRNNDSIEAVIYDNKGEAESMAFNKIYDLTTGDELALADGANGKRVEIDGLPTHASHDGLPIGSVNGVQGTFDGVSGTFKAAAGTVTITLNPANDEPTWTDTLNFIPDEPTTMVMKEDDDYISLGWWLQVNMDANGNLEDGGVMAEIAAWATGEEYDDDTNLTGLVGKATFMGAAAGKFAIKTPATVNAGATYEAGHFTANAELEADFGANNANGMVTGTISSFMQDDASLGDWMVQLAAGFDPTGSPPGSFNAEMGKEIDSGDNDLQVSSTVNGARGTFGDAEVFGGWAARFVDGSREDDMPGAMIGEFHIGNGMDDLVRMIGAFGATNQVADQE